LAAQLATNHPSWTDEKVFQEARKINIAEWQHIVYNEYLPVTIGMATMQAYNIHIDVSISYPID
jgi:peroxidase